MENQTNQVNYMDLLKQTLHKLHDFILEIIPEDKKGTLVEFHNFGNIAILFYVNHLTKVNIVTELESYMNNYNLDLQYKNKILEYLNLVVELKDQIIQK